MRSKLVVTAAAVLSLGLMAAPASAAGHAGPGQMIKEECGVSFGQLIGPAKASGESAHGNYAGGAKAFTMFLTAHGCG